MIDLVVRLRGRGFRGTGAREGRVRVGRVAGPGEKATTAKRQRPSGRTATATGVLDEVRAAARPSPRVELVETPRRPDDARRAPERAGRAAASRWPQLKLPDRTSGANIAKIRTNAWGTSGLSGSYLAAALAAIAAEREGTLRPPSSHLSGALGDARSARAMAGVSRVHHEKKFAVCIGSRTINYYHSAEDPN